MQLLAGVQLVLDVETGKKVVEEVFVDGFPRPSLTSYSKSIVVAQLVSSYLYLCGM